MVNLYQFFLIRCTDAKRQRREAIIVKEYIPSPNWGEGVRRTGEGLLSGRSALTMFFF